MLYQMLYQFMSISPKNSPSTSEVGLDSVRFPLAMAKSSSPPCDGLGVAPSFQAPALPPKRSVRNCLSEQSVPTAIIGKL